MRIDLRQCETLLVNLPEEAERRANATAVCERLGLDWRLVEGVKASPGRTGCGLAHLRALRQATPGRPLLILEDDIEATEDFASEIDCPDDADALYVGVSLYGAMPLLDYVGFTQMVAADAVDERLVRVYNLLGAHAILYLTEDFKAAAQEAILSTLADHDWAHDRGFAWLQETHDVYALRRPMFIQSSELQKIQIGQEARTNVVLDPSPVGLTCSLGVGDDWKPAILERDASSGRLRWRWMDSRDW